MARVMGFLFFVVAAWGRNWSWRYEMGWISHDILFQQKSDSKFQSCGYSFDRKSGHSFTPTPILTSHSLITKCVFQLEYRKEYYFLICHNFSPYSTLFLG